MQTPLQPQPGQTWYLAQPLLDPVVPMRICPFTKYGCNWNPGPIAAVDLHFKSCEFGIFTRCPSCDTLTIFDNPADLVSHIKTTHELVSDPNFDNYVANVKLSHDFLFPEQDKCFVKYLRKCDVIVETKTIPLAILLIAKNHQVSIGRNCVPLSQLDIVAVQLNEEIEKNEHFLEVQVNVHGNHGIAIAPISGQSVISYKSPMDYFRNCERTPSVSFLSQDLLHAGVRHETGVVVNLFVSTVIQVLRVVAGGKLKRHIQPYASSLEQMTFPPAIRMTMSKEDEKRMQQREVRVIVPQLRMGFDVIIEGQNEYAIMDGITTAILSQIQAVDRNKTPWPCKALIVFPSLMFLQWASTEWASKANRLQLGYFKLTTASEEMMTQFKVNGGHIVFTTLPVLDSIMSTNDAKVWQLLTDSLMCLHVHYPSRHMTETGCAILRKLAERIDSSKINSFQKSCFDYFLSKKVCNVLRNTLFSQGDLFLKIGKVPQKVINHNVFVRVGCSCTKCRVKQVCHIIQDKPRKPRRWLISVSSTDDEHLEPLISSLRKITTAQQLSLFKSEEETLRNPNFFIPFMTQEYHVLVAPPSALDFVQLYHAEGIIIYDYPEEKADKLRYAMRARLQENTRVPVFCFKGNSSDSSCTART